MKKYNVKDVIKMEDKMRYFAILDSERLDEEYSFPLLLLGSIGLATAMMPSVLEVREGVNELIPIILGAMTTLYGYGSMAYYCLAGNIADKLYEKIEKIYDTMGDDFKQKVNEERQLIEANKNGRTR